MKKLIVAMALAVVLLASQAFGGGYGNMMLGAKAGLNIASIHGDDAEGWDSRVAFCGGVFTEFPINDMLSFAPEVLYTMKGATTNFDDVDVTWKLSYIEIPMLFKAAIPVSGVVKPLLFAGPEVAFKTSSKLEGESEGVSAEVEFENVKSTDVGFIVGGGIGFPMMSRKASVEVRYDLGLVNIIDVEDADVKTGVVSFLFGIAF